jgi:mono/diheme cytochrome c family protein
MTSVRFTASVLCLLLAITSYARFARAQQRSASPMQELVAKGEYLAHVGDCVACHTVPGGKLFAGGRAIITPFGTLYSTNITPDLKNGIGNWTPDQFYRVMHDGVMPTGELLYPAMPFQYYTKVTRDDLDAIFAYLMSVPAVALRDKPDELRFPYSIRALVIGWRTLYFTPGVYRPNPTQSAPWNRGAYLVEGPGHCGMCHTPINALGGSSQAEAFQGGLIPEQGWYAPSLTSNREGGLGGWSIKDISDLLRTGTSMRGAVYGPMAEVVYNSLQYLSEPDIEAMAVYLKSLPSRPGAGQAAPPVPAAESSLLTSLGKDVYETYCATCHRSDGKGMPPAYPPLANNQSIEMTSAVNPIRMVLNGGFPPGTAGNLMPYGMPPFAQTLSDDQVAAVVTYIRSAWGNHGTPVTARDANTLRAAPLN